MTTSSGCDVISPLLSPDPLHVIHILEKLRYSGPDEARLALGNDCTGCSLINELRLRLSGAPGPRLLLDGIWFSRPVGGISRVWDQILSCWSLPSLFSDSSPLIIVDRGSCLARSAMFDTLPGIAADPLSSDDLHLASQDNARFVQSWNADVFLSSWITSSSNNEPACPELAFVHDCLPERSSIDAQLKSLRLRWLTSASSLLAVSHDTASDLAGLLSLPDNSVPWCHPSFDPIFSSIVSYDFSSSFWQRLANRAHLHRPYVLLPASSSLHTYKNPEILLSALDKSSLSSIHLLLCGNRSDSLALEFENFAPFLKGRIHSVGLSDPELVLAYQHALAVVIPSRIEGFGLPVIEVLASGGIPLIADSRGLREAGAEAALRFSRIILTNCPHCSSCCFLLILIFGCALGFSRASLNV